MEESEDIVRIELLADYPAAVPLLAQWFEREWGSYYGADGPGDARNDLEACCQRELLPIAFVALLVDEVCGTAALKEQSVTTHTHLSPWLAALLVAPGFRRRGVAELLIEAVEERARVLGFGQLYVGTGEGSGTAESPLRKRDWVYIETVPYFVSEVTIFAKML